MFKADVIFKIIFYADEPQKTRIETNAKKEAIEEILEAWLFCQQGQGEDESKPNEKDVYEIEIKLNLDKDEFFTNSDTGNKGLTCGIVLQVFKKLDEIEIRPIS